MRFFLLFEGTLYEFPTWSEMMEFIKEHNAD